MEIASFLNSNFVFLAIIFIFFVLSLKKSTKIVMNAALVSTGFVVVPLLLNKAFSIPVPTDGVSVLHFMLIGLLVYFVWLIGKSIYTVLGNTEKFLKKLRDNKET